jgi:hypothetical protein
MGRGEKGGILFWEAAEGGLGVLRRPADADAGCARACYDCLLSYYNQRDHAALNHHPVRDLLMTLTRAVTRAGGAKRTYEAHYRWLRGQTDARSELERQLLDDLFETKRRLPDAAQQHIEEVGCTPDFFYTPNVCIFCDGSVHDEPQQRAMDEQVRRELKAYGYRVVAIRYDRDLESQIDAFPDVFRESERRSA